MVASESILSFDVWYQVFNLFAEPEKAWYELAWLFILDTIFSFWTNRLLFLRDVTLLIAAIMIIYMFYVLIRKQQNEDRNGSSAKITAPTTFKNTMNINVWLSNMNEHMESKNIKSDASKQALIMNHLDKTAREIMQSKIDSKKINNFKEFEACLKSFFGSSNTSQAINLWQFITRKQQPSESLSTYHELMKELAAIAYPNTPKEIVKQYANDYFVKGLYDEKLKTQ